MIYIHHIPSPPLNHYIDEMYYFEGAALYPYSKLLLMPSLHWMVNIGDVIYVRKTNQNNASVTCAES